MRRMPERPSTSPAQESHALCPRGVTMPTPVTTTRVLTGCSSVVIEWSECTSRGCYVLAYAGEAGGDFARQEAGVAHLLAQGFAGGRVHIDAKAGGFERRQPLCRVPANNAGEH